MAEPHATGYGLVPGDHEGAAPTTQERRTTRKKVNPRRRGQRPEREGVLAQPAVPESSIQRSLGYPLWDLPGLSFLAFFPPVLAALSLMVSGLLLTYIIGQPQGEVAALGALVMLFPIVCLLAMIGGHALQFLADVIRTSAFGHVHHPSLPAWNLVEALVALARFLGVLFCGAALCAPFIAAYGLPDKGAGMRTWLAIGVLIAPGVAYAQVALVAVLLFDDIRAANPFTIFRAMWKMGFRSIPACGMNAGFAAIACLCLPLLFRLSAGATIVATWAYWLMLLYGSMVVARVLGLYYRRNAKRLGWFAEKPQWGVRSV
jgi:hypothetical protein